MHIILFLRSVHYNHNNNNNNVIVDIQFVMKQCIGVRDGAKQGLKLSRFFTLRSR